MKHLFIHVNLLSERFLDSIPFMLQLGQALLDEAVHCLELSKFAGSFFGFLEGDCFSKDDVICEFTGSVGEFCPGCFAVLVGG